MGIFEDYDQDELDEDGQIAAEFTVYVYVTPDGPDIDDVIEAGIVALGEQGKFQLVESELKNSGHF